MNKNIGRALTTVLIACMIAGAVVGCVKKEDTPEELADMSQQTAYLQKERAKLRQIALVPEVNGNQKYPVMKIEDADAICYVYVSYAISCVARTTDEPMLK